MSGIRLTGHSSRSANRTDDRSKRLCTKSIGDVLVYRHEFSVVERVREALFDVGRAALRAAGRGVETQVAATVALS